MKKLLTYTLSALLLAISMTTLHAQSTNDAKAKKILDNVKKEFDSYKTMSMNFDLTIDLPGEDLVVQHGTLLQKADKYQFSMEDQAMYCDGKTLWVHLISNNEVQINNVDENENDFLSPKELLKIYENGDYEYAFAAEEMQNGQKVKQIEFKPTNKNTEYTKMRLSVLSKNNKLQSLKIFSRDGSKYTLNIKKIEANKTLADDLFVFDSSKYEGIYEEDLRID